MTTQKFFIAWDQLSVQLNSDHTGNSTFSSYTVLPEIPPFTVHFRIGLQPSFGRILFSFFHPLLFT